MDPGEMGARQAVYAKEKLQQERRDVASSVSLGLRKSDEGEDEGAVVRGIEDSL